MRIFCGKGQCGTYLGSVGASLVGMNPNPVWRIEPGWVFIDPATGRVASGDKRGILERRDREHQRGAYPTPEYRAEAMLRHELDRIGGPGEAFVKRDPRVAVRREVNLPVAVRCPQCRAVRLVTVEALLRARARLAEMADTGRR